MARLERGKNAGEDAGGERRHDREQRRRIDTDRSSPGGLRITYKSAGCWEDRPNAQARQHDSQNRRAGPEPQRFPQERRSQSPRSRAKLARILAVSRRRACAYTNGKPATFGGLCGDNAARRRISSSERIGAVTVRSQGWTITPQSFSAGMALSALCACSTLAPSANASIAVSCRAANLRE